MSQLKHTTDFDGSVLSTLEFMVLVFVHIKIEKKKTIKVYPPH